MPDQRSGTGLTHTAHEALGRLVREDAVGKLRRRERTMARLGSEDGELKLDLVDAVPRLLADPERLEEMEAQARDLLAADARHVIWAGMGGSVLAVQILRELGFCGCAVTIHTLDSTDPAAINALLRELAAAKGLALPALDAPGAPDRDETMLCRALLGDALMIGVAMGMTSEEPISHLTWHADLLRRAGIATPTRQLAMALPGSYLERYVREHAIPTLPLQLDGGDGTGADERAIHPHIPAAGRTKPRRAPRPSGITARDPRPRLAGLRPGRGDRRPRAASLRPPGRRPGRRQSRRHVSPLPRAAARA